MARCPKLEYKSGTGGFFSECEYYCKLSGQHFYQSDSIVKCSCDAEYGENYLNCDVYKRYS